MNAAVFSDSVLASAALERMGRENIPAPNPPFTLPQSNDPAQMVDALSQLASAVIDGKVPVRTAAIVKDILSLKLAAMSDASLVAKLDQVKASARGQMRDPRRYVIAMPRTL